MNNPFGILSRYHSKEGTGIVKPVPERGPGLYWFLFGSYWYKLIGYSSLTFLLCIPIITAPAAILALNRITMKLAMDHVCVMSLEYWDEFKASFAKSLPVMLIWVTLLTLAALFGYRSLTGAMADTLPGYLLAGAALFVCILLILFMAYFLALHVILDLPVGANIRNALILTLTQGKADLYLLLVTLIYVAEVLFLPYSAALMVFFLPAYVSLARSVIIKPVITEKLIVPEAGKEDEKAETAEDILP